LAIVVAINDFPVPTGDSRIKYFLLLRKKDFKH